jgi:hypothetical protein
MSPTTRIRTAPRRAVAVVLGAVATLVLPLLIGTTAIASATTYREWTLSGVTFDDGGTLSGTLIMADDGTPYSFDVTSAGGTSGIAGTNYSGTPTAYPPLSPQPGEWFMWAPGFGQYLMLHLPDTTSAQESDSLALVSPSWECDNCTPVRYITAGSIVAGGTVDVTPPEIDASVDPTDPDGNNGWYVSSPTVSFTVTDPDSDITNETGCDTQTVDEDTEGTDIVCQATSGGGTNSADIFIRRDATPPTMAPIVTPAHVLLGGPINVAPNADDATSGVEVQRCSASSHVAGAVAASCRAVDLAGNSTHVKVDYTVQYVLAPMTLAGKRKAGHLVQVATQLTDTSGNPIPDKSAAKLGCQVKLKVSGAQTHHSCLTYDPKTDQFSASWKVGKQIGAAELRVAVTYPGSSVKTVQTKAITIKG